MHVALSFPSLIDTQETLEEALLGRIPEQHRASFFHPPYPSELTEADHGVSLENLQAARQRLFEARDRQEKVLIYGDYDCDGVTATAILWETLRDIGLVAKPFLPHREKHGYGMSVAVLETLWEEYQPDLVITVDNGIVAHESLEWLKNKGVYTIVTDHHEPGLTMPVCDILLHSTKLCGATVSWLLAAQLSPEFAKQQLDLAVLGTFSDQVPLAGANRSFAVHGLQALQKSSRPSLVTLARLQELELADADERSIQFGIVPRINAMGRLYDAMDALRALVSQDPRRIQELMQNLETVNGERQQMTVQMVENILSTIEREDLPSILIISGEFHEGIIGLLASKLVDVFHRPAIVLTPSPIGLKASCRSLKGFHITEWLRSLQGEVNFPSLGGHALAAGFSLSAETMARDLALLQEKAKSAVSPDLLASKIQCIGTLDWSMLSAESVKTIQKFRPFGMANEEPQFLLQGIKGEIQRKVGKDQKHWLIRLSDEEQQKHVSAVFFHAEDNFQGDIADVHTVALRLQPSTYRGKTLELILTHMWDGEVTLLEN